MNEPDLNLIHRYLDGALSANELAELEARVNSDRMFADSLAQAARLEADLAALLREDASARDMTSFMQQVETASRPQPANRTSPDRGRKVRTLAWSGVAAALLIAFGTWAIWRSEQIQDNDRPAIAEGPHEVISGEVVTDGASAARIPDGSSIRVDNASPAVIRLADGSEAELRPQARAVLHGHRNDVRQVIELLEGSATFRVTKGMGQFRVETEVGSVTALGTEFTVELIPDKPPSGARPNRRDDALHVAVASGIVEVEYGRHKFLLAGGEEDVFRDDREPRPPRQATERFAAIDLPGGQLRTTTGNENPRESTHRMSAESAIQIDGQPAVPGDLKPRMRVRLTFSEGGQVVAIDAFGPTISGVVRSLEETQNRIVLAGRPREDGSSSDRSFHMLPGLTTDVQPGDRVRLQLSADESKVIRVERDVRHEE